MNKIVKQMLLLGSVFVMLLYMSGCQINDGDSIPTQVGTRQGFLSIIKDYTREQNNYYGHWRGNMEGMPESAVDDAVSDKSTDYSKTNTQVASVDESDTVKTDGEYIYSVSQGRVLVTKAYPLSEAGEVISIDFEDTFYPASIYVDDHHLVVIGQEYKAVEEKQAYWSYYRSNSKVLVYDKTDLTEAKQIFEFDGYMVTSRKVEETLVLILNKGINIYQDNINDSDVLPSYTIDGQVETIGYDDIYYQTGVTPNNVVTIFKINLASQASEIDHYSYIGQSNTIYVSEKNIYAANMVYNYTSGTDTDVKTSVTKINYQDKLESIHTVSVNGRISNQFMMDEYKGDFRITTTIGNSWDDSSTNNLFIYDEAMKLIGSLKGLAKGETIQSTRFVGERVYIVTFKQVDPFFVIDASDPTKPILLGELKIPGFSTYMHPYDDNHVIGFGFEGNNDGRITGFKMALFDVTDPTKPVEKFKETILYDESGYNHTELTYNHKALLFSLEKNLIGFPFSTSDYSQTTEIINGQKVIRYNYTYKQEYKVYGLDLTSGFVEKATISHFTEGKTEEYMYLNEISRGLYIDHLFYTVSNSKIMAHSLESFELEKIIALPVIEEPNHYYYPKFDIWMD